MAINAGTVFINVVANTEAFKAQMLGLGKSLVTTGAAFTRAGSLMTRGITVPLGLAGLAAAKLALDYRSAFVKIAAVTDASQEQIHAWRDDVLNLAGKTARAPEELAEALYFLASAGLDSKEVFPALQATAKAAASGLGETADIARLTANALNAYGKSGLKAIDVTDTLVAAVKLGTAEPDEFAHAMGRILPIASKAGVEFDELAASLATVSNIGLNVNEGVTAMRGLLQALIAPGTQAAETMEELGISTTEMRESLRTEGILETVRMIERLARAEFGEGWIDVVRKIIPNIRALTGALGLTAQEAENVDKVFEGVKDATGEMGKAFERTQKGPEFQLQQGLTKLKTVGIEVGNVLLPIIIDVVREVGRLLEGFRKLSPELQENIVKWGLLAIALGPVVRILGGVLTVVGLLTKGIAKLIGLAAGIGRLATALTGLGAASAGAQQLTLFGGAGGAAGGAAAKAGLIASAAALGKFTLIAAGAAAVGLVLHRSFEDLANTSEELSTQTGLTVENIDALEHQLSNGAAAFNLFSSQTDKVVEAGKIANEVAQDYAETVGISVAQAQSKVNAIFKDSINDIGGLTGSMDTLEQNLRGRLGILEAADAVTLLNRRFEELLATQIELEDRAVVPEGFLPSGFKPEEMKEFLAAAISVRNAGLSLDEVFGDQLRAALEENNGLWAILTARMHNAGLAMPYERAGDLSKAIFEAANATVEQRKALADTIALLDKYNIKLKGAVLQSVQGAIASSRLGEAQKIISDSIGDEALDAVLENASALNKQQGEWIANALAAGDYLAVLERIQAIERNRRREQERQRREGFRNQGGEVDPTAAMGADVRAQAQAIADLLRMEPRLKSFEDVLRGALGAENVDFTNIKNAVGALGDLGVKYKDLSKATRKKLTVLLEAGKAQQAADLLYAQLIKLSKVEAKPKVNLDSGNTQATLTAIRNQLADISGMTATARVIISRQIIEGRHSGGLIDKLHGGGRPKSDERDVRLQTGEFVMQRSAVRRIGVGALEAMNSGIGGLVGAGRNDSGPKEITGQLRMVDWKNGIAELAGELEWASRK